MGSYISSTLDQQREMLATCGFSSFEELFSSIPDNVKLSSLNLPNGMSEMQVGKALEEISEKNTVFKSIFRGAGAYDHYIPAIVKSVVSKEEFLTAYTPYQAEISQGILQSIFEYQTAICRLTGMETSNASVYDGATAAAEAVAMCKDRKRSTAIVCESANPQYIQAIETYCFGSNTEVIRVPANNGKVDVEALKAALTDTVACVFFQTPNYFGQIEDAQTISDIAHGAGAKLIACVNPISLAIMKTPAEYGADIAVGEGQPLGMPLAFGGPYLGFMAASAAMTRKLPGRIVGETKDANGKRAFVLTLQAREQHIRREKASSNICSNEALCALTAAVYVAAMGASGLKSVAEQSCNKAHYFATELEKIGFELKYGEHFFNEFVTSSASSAKALKALETQGILGGLPLNDNDILWCCTEKNSKADIDKAVAAIKEVG